MAPVKSFKVDRSVAPRLDAWPAWEIITSGKPDQSGYLATQESDGLMTGIWECKVGKFSVDQFFAKSHEFAYILEGKVTITSADGDSGTYAAGETIITPAGFKGYWEILEPIRKIFAISKI